MNDPVDSQKCVTDSSYCRFGCKAIRDLLDGFEDNIDGVIQNEDVECFHKTRVTSRKLRAALPLFQPCFPSKKCKRWIKEIKKVTVECTCEAKSTLEEQAFNKKKDLFERVFAKKLVLVWKQR
jgi:hypothetical protein